MTNPQTVSTHYPHIQESQQKIVEEKDGMIQLNLKHPKVDRNQRFEANQLAEKFLYENKHLVSNLPEGQVTN